MDFLKDGVLYNTETSTKIGEPIHFEPSWEEPWVDDYKTLYLSKKKWYYLLVTSALSPSCPIDVKVLTNDEDLDWATRYLSVDTVKKHFSDKIKEG